ENVPQWQRTVRRVAEYSLTRPIYRNVDHVQEFIRSRPDPRKEAFAIVSVKESDIIKGYAGKKETDAFGHELVTLREGTLSSVNVQQFIHGDLVYDFIDNELVLVS
ncbi:MAG: type IVB secretion system protein IcmQ, partial [Coxiellaceae bacterium]|nr:type IVB secretion system protein IcmQ [Coxiellaceae bacterium]